MKNRNLYLCPSLLGDRAFKNVIIRTHVRKKGRQNGFESAV